MRSVDRHPDDRVDNAEPGKPAVSRYAVCLTALLSLAMIGLNHDFDVVGGRFEETVTSGGGLEEKSAFERSVVRADAQRLIGFLVLLTVGGLALLGPPQQLRPKLDTITVLALAALGWAVLSFVWSTSPNETARELVRLLGFTFTGAALVRRFSLRELMFLFATICLVSIAVDVAADIAAGTFQPWTRGFRLGGTLHANHMGRLGAIVALIGWMMLGNGRLLSLSSALITTGVVVVLMSGSRSGTLGLVAGLAAMQIIGLPRRRICLIVSGASAIAAIGLFVVAVLPPSTHRLVTQAVLMGRTEDSASLTGRVPLWQEMWRDASERMGHGFGYGAYWTVDRNYQMGEAIEWFPRHSHSAYLELFVDLGLVGVLLVVTLAMAAVARCIRLAVTTGRPEYRLLGALLICAMANGFLEVNFVAPRFEGLFVGMAVLVLALRPAESAAAVASDRMAPAPAGSPRSEFEMRTNHASRPYLT